MYPVVIIKIESGECGYIDSVYGARVDSPYYTRVKPVYALDYYRLVCAEPDNIVSDLAFAGFEIEIRY